MIRLAKTADLLQVKRLVDSVEEMDTIPETFPETYFKRLLRKGIILVDAVDSEITGVCFGTYKTSEGWADLLGLVVKPGFRNQGIGTALVRRFEQIARSKGLATIDLYADKKQVSLFKTLGYIQGRTYFAFRRSLL